jgi:uncharacterized membrane protein YbaN (DUF454 family)
MWELPNRTVELVIKITGTVFLIIGGVGIILPLLPTTPFLLLALACYAKSSKRLYNWLLYNKWFGEYIKNWHEGRGIPVKTKILTIALLFLTIGYSVAFVVPSFIGKAFFIVYQV